MARCLPFPPPEYLLNGVSGRGVSLLELVKVRREEKRRKKKEKRRRREEEEELEEGEIREENYPTHKNKMYRDIGGYENQLSEKSSLTEELKRPVSDFLYDSSNSTNNIKQKYGCCFFARTSETCLQCVESLYTELTVKWVPPDLPQHHFEFDGQGWLFKRKLLKSSISIEICSAYHDDMAQADIYARPFTALF